MTVTLADVRARIQGCRRCCLGEGRTNIVFGSGSEDARVMVIGEAPGRNEDLQGEPFVGAAGKFLDELLSVASLVREEVFIANVLKCRPPSNRDPQVPEIEACADYLRDQVRAIRPDVLVTLGNFATKFILRTDRGISALRGTVQHAGRFTVCPMFHPAVALYDPSKKDLLRGDFKNLRKVLDSMGESLAEPGADASLARGAASDRAGEEG